MCESGIKINGDIKLRLITIVMTLILICNILEGCSTTVYQRQRDEKNPIDQGMESKLKLQGPRAVLETKF